MKAKDVLKRLAGSSHRGSAFSSDTLVEVASTFPERIETSLETGCGVSTVMFSNLSQKHYVFAYDDRESPESSVNLAQSSPDFRSERVQFVFGPTQKTLPRHDFPEETRFDVILLDGPHGYPFPELEYAVLYDKLKPGGLLILDDIHIPSIGNMFAILREDRMYDQVGIFATTGILRRTDLEGVASDGDGWVEQGYNTARFPLAMERFEPDRAVPIGAMLDLSKLAVQRQLAVSGLSPDPAGRGLMTIDLAARMDLHLEPIEGPLTVELTYQSLSQEASRDAAVRLGETTVPLPYAAATTSLTIVTERPKDGCLRLLISHPAAATEHDLVSTRFDFRRLGSIISSIRVSDGNPKASISSPEMIAERNRRSEEAFATALADAADEFFPQLPEPILRGIGPLAGQPVPNHIWHFSELLADDGLDAADRLAATLRDRSPTPNEMELMSTRRPWDHVEVLLILDEENRKSGSRVRIVGLGAARALWKLRKRLEATGNRTVKRLSQSIFKRYVANMVSAHRRQIAFFSGLNDVKRRMDRIEARK